MKVYKPKQQQQRQNLVFNLFEILFNLDNFNHLHHNRLSIFAGFYLWPTVTENNNERYQYISTECSSNRIESTEKGFILTNFNITIKRHFSQH
jgi:hypothetical protein